METMVQVLTKPVDFQEASINEKWSSAFALWLSSKSGNTRRAYEMAWEQLLDFTGKMPWEMGSADVETWVGELRKAYSESTVQQRLAAVSSFFSYARLQYMDIVDGVEVPLYRYNPAKAVNRPKVQPYGKAHPLTIEDVRALLNAIPRTGPQGLRDYALILAFVLTGRRNSEIRNLRWGDLEQRDGRFWYTWQGKGCTSGRYELPAAVAQAMMDWLISADRMDEIQPDDYIFTPLCDHANRFPGVDHDPGRPLSTRYIRDVVKKYARLAGLDADQVRVHDLRHTAAMLRAEAGDDVRSISAFLGHADLRTTSRYLFRVGGRKDESWKKVCEMLSL
ncbi:MAG TPA: tyrosine-type recombinase/integrase [Brevefilum sp.]|jgi:integrase|nr:tyrosine-type recombinase/integrase [Brevefilum sp.]